MCIIKRTFNSPFLIHKVDVPPLTYDLSVVLCVDLFVSCLLLRMRVVPICVHTCMYVGAERRVHVWVDGC